MDEGCDSGRATFSQWISRSWDTVGRVSVVVVAVCDDEVGCDDGIATFSNLLKKFSIVNKVQIIYMEFFTYLHYIQESR